MSILAGIAGALLVVVIMWDAFEAIVLPRRVTRRLRPTRFFYRTTWRAWSTLAGWMHPAGRRETYLSFYGPLSLLLLLTVWAANLILGFALMQWALGSRLDIHGRLPGFGDDLYMSGTTFFTLGLGDVVPTSALARALTVIESGTGFGFLALVIGYFPVLYQAFSRREVNITLLDARAGSPPTAGELLRRHGDDLDALTTLLREWEHWAAEVLESHLSYPVLSFFRSQHDNQSWLAALTTILDASALVITGIEGACARQAQLTFAMARHAVVDLAQVLGTPPRPGAPSRLPPGGLGRLRAELAANGVYLRLGHDADERLAELRSMYEGYTEALARRLLMPLPRWLPSRTADDNWRNSAWEQATLDGSPLPALESHPEED